VFATKRAPHSPLRALGDATEAPVATWRIGMVHGSIAIPGKTEHDEVVITTDEIAATGLDYLALGHWHSTQKGKAGAVTYAVLLLLIRAFTREEIALLKGMLATYKIPGVATVRRAAPRP